MHEAGHYCDSYFYSKACEELQCQSRVSMVQEGGGQSFPNIKYLFLFGKERFLGKKTTFKLNC